MRRTGSALTRALDASAAFFAVVVIVFVCLGGVVTLPLNRAGQLENVQWAFAGLAVAAVISTPLRRWGAWAPWTFIAVWAVLFAWMPHAIGVAPDARAAGIELRRFGQCLIFSAALLACVRGARLGLTGVRVGWLVALLVCGGVGLWEVVTGDHLLFLDPKRGWPFGERMPAATWLNPNNLATMLVGMIAGTWALRAQLNRCAAADGRHAAGAAHREETSRRRARPGWWNRAACGVLDVLVVLAAVVVAFTQSRMGLLALVAVFGLEAWRRWPDWQAWWSAHHRQADAEAERSRGRLASAPALLAGAGVLAASAVASVTVPALARHNPIVGMVGMLGAEETARSDSLRLQLIAAAMRYLRESGWLGSGAGSFEPLLWADPDPGVVTLTNLHNAFVELLSQYGVVVGAVHAAALLAVLAAAALPGRLPRDHRVEILGFLAAYVAFGVVASSSLTIPGWWLLHATAVASWWAGSRTPSRHPGPARIDDLALGKHPAGASAPAA